jgi:protein-tyrosine phosphatase
MDATGAPEGRIDVHSHILPGIDDGCPTIEDSLNCIRQFISAGYAGTICTPHISPRIYPHNTPKNVKRCVAELQAAVDQEGLSYQLWAGGELVMAVDNWSWFENDGFPTLGNSKAILMDWWGPTWPQFAGHFLDRLQAAGYQPILAHPERMKLPVTALKQLVESLADRGVWLQGNLNSLSGGEGPQSQELAQQWLQEGRYYILASDTHHPELMQGRLAGLQVAIDLVGRDRVQELISRRTGLLARGDTA